MDGIDSAVFDPAWDGPASSGLAPVAVDEAWALILAVRRRTDQPAGACDGGSWGFRAAEVGWVPAADPQADVLIDRQAAVVTNSRRPLPPDTLALLELHLDRALRPRSAGSVLALLGQSLDGFIATRAGHSRFINGSESLVHLHRMRALSDAVMIGVGTALADEPRLTTRHVAGPHATRVVIDPRGRLSASSGLLNDGAAETIVIRATEGAAAETRLGDQTTILCLPATQGGISPRTVVDALAERGKGHLLIEGGGITVGRFLEAGLVERLQLAVSPLIIGSGRPALPITPADRLDQALRFDSRRYHLGNDVLFDLRFPRVARSG